MPNSLQIGDLAERTGRSIHAIRWYEAQGLIPGVVRDNGGRRVYSELHLSWLDLIHRLRTTGMSIAQMREYVLLVRRGRGTLRQRQKLLASHRANVLEKIKEWKLAVKLIDKKIDFYGQWLTTGRRPPLPTAGNSKSSPGPRIKGRRSRVLKEKNTHDHA